MPGLVTPLLALGVSLGLVMCSGSSPANRGGLDASDGVAQGGSSSSGGGATGSSSGGASSGAPGGDDGSPGTTAGGDGAAASSSGSPATEAGAPADCPASDMGNTALGTDTPDPTGTAVDAITYTAVGTAGSYDQVVSSTMAPSCVANTCNKTPKSVSGPLAPFNEEMTMVFSGPMDLYQIAAYEPGSGGWARTAYWDRCTTDGLAFVGNKHWYTCGGNVQSYVTDDGTKESQTPVQFAGHLDAGVGVNVMSSTLCTATAAGSDCGFSLGLALHGFAGDGAGSKIFAAKLRMPIGDVTPAYWILPAQVVRSSQYGCNCRGEGGQGGCGELDVAEVLGGNTSTPTHPEQATTTIYSFQGVTNGGTSYFQRPVYETATFLVVFDAASSSIALRRLGPTDFDFGGAIPEATVNGWLANAGTTRKMP
jgi:hypothetical protein